MSPNKAQKDDGWRLLSQRQKWAFRNLLNSPYFWSHPAQNQHQRIVVEHSVRVRAAAGRRHGTDQCHGRWRFYCSKFDDNISLGAFGFDRAALNSLKKKHIIISGAFKLYFLFSRFFRIEDAANEVTLKKSRSWKKLPSADFTVQHTRRPKISIAT